MNTRAWNCDLLSFFLVVTIPPIEIAPFSSHDFERHTALPWSEVSDRVLHAIERGLISQNDAGFMASELGWRFLNDTQQIFLP